MFSFITTNLLWTEGGAIAAVLALLCIVGWRWFKPLAVISLLMLIFCFYFFRNPERICPETAQDPTVIICPADGTIIDLAYDKHAAFESYEQKVSIFLSPLDVHVNWMPVSGLVTKIAYTPGSFMPAYLPKSSEYNEHNDVYIRLDNGRSLMVRQIAGFIARRIRCWIQEGRSVHAGDKYGMIRFGSRVDVYLPASANIEVGMGQRVYGGKTVLGRWQ